MTSHVTAACPGSVPSSKRMQLLVLRTGDMVKSGAAGIEERAAAALPWRLSAALLIPGAKFQEAQACKAAKEPLLCVLP